MDVTSKPEITTFVRRTVRFWMVTIAVFIVLFFTTTYLQDFFNLPIWVIPAILFIDFCLGVLSFIMLITTLLFNSKKVGMLSVIFSLIAFLGVGIFGVYSIQQARIEELQVNIEKKERENAENQPPVTINNSEPSVINNAVPQQPIVPNNSSNLITCNSKDNKCPSVQMTAAQCAQTTCCEVEGKWFLTPSNECIRLHQDNARVAVTAYNGNVYYCDKNSIGAIQSASNDVRDNQARWKSCDAGKWDKIRTCENSCYDYYEYGSESQSSCLRNCNYEYCSLEKINMTSSQDTFNKLVDRHCN